MKISLGGEAKCDDMSEACSFWASKGLCGPGHLHNWMYDNCCHTCKSKIFHTFRKTGVNILVKIP